MPFLIVTKTPEQWVDFWGEFITKYPANSGSVALISSVDGFNMTLLDEKQYRTDREYKERMDKLVHRTHVLALTDMVKHYLSDDSKEHEDEGPKRRLLPPQEQ